MQYLVVIDTNVIVSALISKHTDASTVQIFNAMLTGRITPVYNDEILAEYGEVLRRKNSIFQNLQFRLPSTTYENMVSFRTAFPREKICLIPRI